MGKFDDWLQMAKKTKLRKWLNMDELNTQLEQRKDKMMLYAAAQSSSGLQSLKLRINSVEKRMIAEAAGDHEGVLEDMLLNCTLITVDDEEKPLQVKASQFMPIKGDHELASLSRLFVSAIHRDQFVEDAEFCISVLEDDQRAHQQRVANSFFKRFLGGAGPIV